MIDFNKVDYLEILRIITDCTIKTNINISRIIRIGQAFSTYYTDTQWLSKDIRYWALLHDILDRFSGKPWTGHPEIYTTLMISDLTTVLTTQQIISERNKYLERRKAIFKQYGISTIIDPNTDNVLMERQFILILLQKGMMKDIVVAAKVLSQLHHVFNIREDIPTLDLTYSKLGLASGANNQAFN